MQLRQIQFAIHNLDEALRLQGWVRKTQADGCVHHPRVSLSSSKHLLHQPFERAQFVWTTEKNSH